jgi:hypothetical protein
LVIRVKLLKETVKNMGKVENIQLLVMPDPWFDFIVSNGDKGECPETFEQCEKYLSEYKGKILVFFISLIFICLLGTYRIIDGNHRCIAFQELGIMKHGCHVLAPKSKNNVLLTIPQLHILNQGYNFLNSSGTFHTSVLEMILTLHKVLPNYIKRKKDNEVR